MSTTPSIIQLSQLRPTQITVGLLQVKHKRERIRLLEKRPSELVDFILEHPIRVVAGPSKKFYVVDHHHLALALLRDKFETAPMIVEKDLSAHSVTAFWKELLALEFVHPYDTGGVLKPLSAIPKSIEKLRDDPYRSLAGFVREAGGFTKVETPYAEFLWANYYRSRIKTKLLNNHFKKALKQAIMLSHHDDAQKLPGFVNSPKP